MTRVDFYILQDVDLSAMQRFACRLACKAVDSGNRVYLHTTTEQCAKDFDDLLWAYPEQRFMPHARADDEAAAGAPIVIGWDQPEGHDGVLINLSDHIPTFFGRFDRVAEIVVAKRQAAAGSDISSTGIVVTRCSITISTIGKRHEQEEAHGGAQDSAHGSRSYSSAPERNTHEQEETPERSR